MGLFNNDFYKYASLRQFTCQIKVFCIYFSEFDLKAIVSTQIERDLTQYFLNTRQQQAHITNKWGTDITRTAVALFLTDERFFAPGNEIGEEIAYELALQLMSKLVM